MALSSRRKNQVDSSDEEVADREIQQEPALEQRHQPEAPAKQRKTRKRREMEELGSRNEKQGKKKGKTEDDEKYAYNIINDMREIYSKDLALASEGKPATNRLNTVEGIAERVLRRNCQMACLRLGVLNEVRIWLEPFENKRLPNQKIKKVLLDLLGNLRVTRDDLQSSEVGKIVHFYSKNSREAKDVRRMAVDLIKKWKGVVIREEMQEE